MIGRAVTSLRGWAGRNSDPLVRYGLPALAGAAMPLLWFRPGRYFASGDVGPFVRQGLAAELGSVWGHQISGAGGPSYEVARLPDILLTWLCGLFGLGATAAQALLYALILGGAAVGTSYLASCWLRRPSAAACAGVLSVVNVYQLVSLLNPLPALAGALTAVLGGQLLRAAQGRRIRAAWFALATLPLCYLGANPPLLALVAVGTVVIAACSVPLTGGRAAPVAALLLRAAPLAVGIQLWWLLPELITLQSGGSAAQFSAQTNVQSWAWTQTRNTLGNIVTLNSHWGWRYPEYYPFAPAMGRWPWSALRWAPPLLALAGAVLPPGTARNRRALRGLAAAGAVLVLLCKGLHAPLAGVNAWLYQWVPGMWMFREPMSKFGVLLVLVVAILAGAAVERALEHAALEHALDRPAEHAAIRGAVPRAARWARVGAVLLVVAAVAYPWPLWTGAVVTQARTPEFSASVAVPADWQRIADRANASPVQGKVLELPLQGYYQVLTTWGYHGADNVPQQLLTRPLLQRLPGGYFDAAPALSQLLSLAQQSLVDGRTGQALGALRALDVGQVIVRKDLIADPGEPATADPRSIAAGLARAPGVRTGLTTPVGQLFELTGPVSPPALLTADRAADAATIAAAAGAGAATTDDPAVPVDQASFDLAGPTREGVDLLRGGDYTLSVRHRLGVGYLPALRGQGSAAQVVLTQAQQTALDGTTLPAAPPMTIPLDLPTDRPAAASTPSALLVDGRPVPWSEDSPVTVRPGQEVAAAVPSGTGELVDAGNGSVGADGGCSGSAGNGSVTRLPGRGWRVEAVRGTACLRLPLNSVPPSGLVSLSLAYRTGSGIGPRLCLWQSGPESCALSQQLPASTGWHHWSAVLRIAPGTSALALYGYADADPAGSGAGIADYRDVSATALTVAGRVRAPGAADVTVPWKATAGRHLVRSRQAGSGGQVGAAAIPLGFTGLQDCGRVDSRSFGQTGLVLRPLGAGGVHLEARAHTACTSVLPASSPLQVDGGNGSPGEYRLTLRYRTLSGAPARLCLWQIGPNRCATLPAMADSKGWTTLDTQVTPQPGTTSLALYLYADGEDAGTTAVEYDAVQLSPVPPPLRLSLTATARPATVALQMAPSGNGRFRIGLAGLDGSRLVALPDSHDSRWQLQGLPSGWTARPLEVDGYRQAWLVTGHGDAVLHAAFGPDIWWHRAVAVSLFALLVAVLLLLSPFRPAARRTSPPSAAAPTELPEPLHARFPQQPADLGGRADARTCTAGDPAARFAGRSGLHRGRGADQRRPPL